MAYTGRLRPKGVQFLGFRYIHFMAVKKSIKCSGVVVYSYVKGQRIDSNCDPPQEFDARGESTLTTRLQDTLSVPYITDMRILP